MRLNSLLVGDLTRQPCSVAWSYSVKWLTSLPCYRSRLLQQLTSPLARLQLYSEANKTCRDRQPQSNESDESVDMHQHYLNHGMLPVNVNRPNIIFYWEESNTSNRPIILKLMTWYEEYTNASCRETTIVVFDIDYSLVLSLELVPSCCLLIAPQPSRWIQSKPCSWRIVDQYCDPRLAPHHQSFNHSSASASPLPRLVFLYPRYPGCWCGNHGNVFISRWHCDVAASRRRRDSAISCIELFSLHGTPQCLVMTWKTYN